MNIFEIRINLYLLSSIPLNQTQMEIANFIDSGFVGDEKLMKMHEENAYKPYSFALLYPIEREKIYRKGKIYTVTIRTIDRSLAVFFSEHCANHYTDTMKGLTAEIKIIPKKMIECLYNLTPSVLKDKGGYWRTHMSLQEFENRMKINLIKKWNFFRDDKLSEDFQLYTMLEFLNDGPISIEYKGIKLLGDKVRIQVADNETAQNLAYLALATGLCENNSRGCGFVNYRWL